MKKELNYLFTILLLTFLTGCPLSKIYNITDKSFQKNYGSKVINNKNLVITFSGGHPWLIKKKKHIYLNFQLINLNDSLEQVYYVNDLNLFCKEDSFTLFNEKPFTIYGSEKENSNSINLKSGEQKKGWFDFCSEKDYSKNEFNRSISNDTIKLKINSLNDYGFLIGKVFKNK